MSRRLLLNREKTSTIPPLKTEEGIWALHPRDKTELFAKVFPSKWEVPLLGDNRFTHSLVSLPHPSPDSFMLVRRHKVKYFLVQFSESSATGPDGIGATVLRVLAEQLSYPIVKLIRRILCCGQWPEIWMHHWI